MKCYVYIIATNCYETLYLLLIICKQNKPHFTVIRLFSTNISHFHSVVSGIDFPIFSNA